MKNFFLFAFLYYATIEQVGAQIVQQWLSTTPYGSSLQGSNMRLLQDGILTFNTDFLMDGSQQGWKVDFSGQTIWNFEHQQFNDCPNCVWAQPTALAIRADGMAFQAGQQSTFPFDGSFITRINADGVMEYSNEYYYGSGSSELLDGVLSNDESKFILSGSEFSEVTGLLSPYLYKYDLAGQLILKKDIGIYNFELYNIINDENDNVYANTSTVDTIRLVSFDSNFEQRWLVSFPAPEFLCQGTNHTVRPQRFSNGDILFPIYTRNYVNLLDADLHLIRMSVDGQVIWHTVKEIDWINDYTYKLMDLHIDANDNIFTYFERVLSAGGGGIAQEHDNTDQNRSIASSILQIRPEVYKFNPEGVFQWYYLNNGASASDAEDFLYCGKVVCDELGNAIISAAHTELLAGAHYSILTPDGSLNSTYYESENLEIKASSLVYAGNQEFYSNNIGLNGVWTMNKFSYTIVPATAQHVQKIRTQIYPNPSEGVFTLRFSEPYHGTICLTDIQGKVITQEYASALNMHSIDLSDKPAGLYLLKVGEETYKLCVTSR